MTLQLFDNILFQNFVNPLLCQKLYECGVYFKLKFYWIVRQNNKTELISSAFDPDNYYEPAQSLIDSFNPPQTILPAYSIKEMDKVLPSYTLSKSWDKYHLSLCRPAGLFVEDVRLPDVYAKMVLSYVNYDTNNINSINSILSNQDIKI